MSYDRGSREINGEPATAQEPRLLDRVRRCLRVKHYSLRTKHAYVGWIRRFILANGKQYPRGMSAAEIGRFLPDLAVQRDVAVNTQDRVMSALLFLFREVLGLNLPRMESVVRAERPRRLRRAEPA